MRIKIFWLCLIVLLSNNSFAGDANIKESYYPTGEVKYKYTMKDGNAHGLAQQFDKRGHLTKEFLFENGKPSDQMIKTWDYYDTNQIKLEYVIDNGDGYRKRYFENGQIHTVFEIKGGVVSNYKEYDLDGTKVVDQKGTRSGSNVRLDDHVALYKTEHFLKDDVDTQITSLNIDKVLKRNVDSPFVGFWKTDCSLDFGVAVQRLDQTSFYNLIFCTSEGCRTRSFRKKTDFYNDKDFRVMDENRFRMKVDGMFEEYHRCE